jgi:hypothetical protein
MNLAKRRNGCIFEYKGISAKLIFAGFALHAQLLQVKSPITFVPADGWMAEVAALTPPASSCAARPLQLGSDAAAAHDGMKALQHIKATPKPNSGLCCSIASDSVSSVSSRFLMK